MFYYELALFLYATYFLPKALIQKKYRQNFRDRLGKSFSVIEKSHHPLIWVHAVSVGETRAISPLVRRIRKKSPNSQILVSSITQTGHAEARRSLSEADHHLYLPFDFSWIIRPIVERLKPNLVLLSETDYWFNFLHAAKQNGAKIAVVNGKMSEKSQSRYKKFSRYSKNLFELIDLICTQNNQYKERFIQCHLPESKLTITGNLKFDQLPSPMTQGEIDLFKKQLGISSRDKVLVIGSTHDPEEKEILQQLKKFPQLKVIIVPRHPERFDEVAKLLKDIPFHRYTEKPKPDSKVILIDAMGKLIQCYQIANVAIVAGSYTKKVGGHNILEPAMFGIPTLYGPYMHSQPELLELSQSYQAGIQTPLNMIPSTLEFLLSNEKSYQELSDNCFELIKEQRGATDKTWGELKKIYSFS